MAQNSESVMKAYGVPKLFGANNSYGDGSGNNYSSNNSNNNGGNMSYMRYDGSKVPTGGVSGGGSVASYGLYQQGSKIGGQKKY